MKNREGFVWGIILVLAGLLFLAFQLFPGMMANFSWTWIFIGIGLVFLVAAILTRTGGLFIPAALFSTLGGIFIYQTTTDNWESWAYIWTLLPASVAVGMLVGGLFDRGLREARGVAIVMLVASLVGLAIFGGAFGLSPEILRYWPVLLILVGIWILFKGVGRSSVRDN